MGQVVFVPEIACSQDKLFEEVLAAYGTALERLAHAYEAEPETHRDLLQEMHIALWRSLEGFDNRCSLRTWVYRVAHNTAASHVTRQLRMKKETLVGLEQLADLPDRVEGEEAAGRRHSLEQLLELIRKLEPLDRQVMVAYLEGMDAASTAEITGLSARNVATRTNPGHLEHPGVIIALYAMLIAALFLVIAKLNSRAARRIQGQIEELDELSRQS